MDSWNSLLPDELLVDILTYLDVRTLVEIKPVCHQWKVLSTNAIDAKGIGTTRKAFENNQELREAVRQYCPIPQIGTLVEGTAKQEYCDRETAERIASTYGWPINKWDVSNIEFFSSVFDGEQEYNEETDEDEFVNGISCFNEDISAWNVSKAFVMAGMFSGAMKFNQELSSWDVSNVISMAGMFHRAFQFNDNISSWNVSNVINMRKMFYGAEHFNQDISTWNVSNVTNMDMMFCAASQFNQNISTWDVSNVTDMRGMFMHAKHFNQDISTWNVSNVTNMISMFSHAGQFDQDLSNWDVSNVTTRMERMLSTRRQFNRVFRSTSSNKKCIIM